ncbi:MAG TPA: hypothetical protein VM287_10045 [Egibacteraceae bacterium]|nr:hypothetical protein [Egibacteraceae bacterium]
MTLVPLSPPAKRGVKVPVRMLGSPRRAERRWYEKKRYILLLGIVVSAVLGTAAGSLRDEASSQPHGVFLAAQVVPVDDAPFSAR